MLEEVLVREVLDRTEAGLAGESRKGLLELWSGVHPGVAVLSGLYSDTGTCCASVFVGSSTFEKFLFQKLLLWEPDI